MVKSAQLPTNLKNTSKIVTRSRNNGTNNTPLTPRTEEDEKAIAN